MLFSVADVFIVSDQKLAPEGFNFPYLWH